MSLARAPRRPIPRLAAPITAAEFEAQFVAKNIPVILSGQLSHWFQSHSDIDTEGDWSLASLQSLLGDCSVTNVFQSFDGRFKFFNARSQDTVASTGADSKRAQRLSMTFNEFVDLAQHNNHLDNDSTPSYYLYGEPLPTPLQAILTPPAILNDEQSLTSSLVWLAINGSLSPLHYDLSEGVLCQLSGSKHFTLIPPQYYSELKPHDVSSKYDRQSSLTLSDISRDVSGKSIESYEGVVSSGELIYLPYGWWHEVTSTESLSVSVTYRWNPYEQPLHSIALTEHKLQSQSLPPAVIVSILAQSLSVLPAVVCASYMRRSTLASDFQSQSLISVLHYEAGDSDGAASDSVQFIRRCHQLYRQGCDASLIRSTIRAEFPNISDICTSECQRRLYARVADDPLSQTFPPHEHVAAVFWRTVIALIAQHQPLVPELHKQLQQSEAIIERAETSDHQRDNVTVYQQPWFRCYDVSVDGTTHTIKMRVQRGFLNNIGLVQWPGGFLLTDYILSNRQLFAGRRVCELGAGIGLSSVLLSLAKPRTIVTTDFEDKVLDNIQFNFATNAVTDTDDCIVRVENVDWTNVNDRQIESFGCDTIIAAEVTYLPELLQPLAKLIAKLLSLATNRSRSAARPFAILAQTERHPLFFVEYLGYLRDEGLSVAEIDCIELPKHFIYERENIYMHRVTLPE